MANRVASPIFVGRQHELELVRAALAGAVERGPAFVLVAGEAGVGKTRFVHELTTDAEAAGARILQGGCLPLGGEGIPFGAVIDALRGLIRELSPEETDRLAASGRAELARLMPDLAQDAEPASGTRSDSSGQGRLFEHLLRFLERLADRAPLVLVIEDIHWADRSSLELLDFLGRNLRHGSICLIATYRTDELQRNHPLVPFLAELERSGRVERVELTGFDRRELANLAEAILGEMPEPEAFERLAARSQGNAFYAEELLAVGPGERHIPPTLREVLLARLAGVSQPTQELLRVASASGARIPTALLPAVMGATEQGLQERLREAVDRNVLVPLAEADREQFAFRHALIQEAIYGDLLPGERVRVHSAYAQALVEDADGEASASRAAELAYHWQAAGVRPRAFEAWIEAGIAAEAIDAFAEAGAHYERALELWEHVPDGRNRAGFDRIELYVRAAAAIEATAPVRSIGHVLSALALIDPATEATRAGLLHARLGDYNTYIDEIATAHAAYREAVRLVPADPPSPARAHVLTELGRCQFFLNTEPDSRSICEEAVRVARAVGAPRAESSALIPLATHLVADGEVDLGLALARRARLLAAEIGDVYGLARAMTNTAMLLIYAGRYDEAVTAALEGAAYAERHGLAARFGSSNLLWAARALVELGRWNEACDALAGSQSVVGMRESDLVYDLLLFAARRGDFEAAGELAEQVRSRVKPHFYENIVAGADGLAELALWQGDPMGAREATRTRLTAFEANVHVHVTEVGAACTLGLRAEADLAGLARARRSEPKLGEARRAGAALLQRMRTATDAIAARSRHYLPQAQAWLATCEAEFSRLEGPSDRDLWAAAAAAWGAFGNPYHTAYALMREGEAALGAPRDRPQARRVLSEAKPIAVRLGAAPLEHAIDVLAARAGTRPSVRRIDGLSRREQEVLSLVAAGRSNAEIGETLYISRKTASVHVANIKAKLGAHSRIEIATSAIGRDSLDLRHDRA
jgi:DNA-binding CsgD family transcriptional regulator/tetratricopeptide (TPR) repeat protein